MLKASGVKTPQGALKAEKPREEIIMDRQTRAKERKAYIAGLAERKAERKMQVQKAQLTIRAEAILAKAARIEALARAARAEARKADAKADKAAKAARKAAARAEVKAIRAERAKMKAKAKAERKIQAKAKAAKAVKRRQAIVAGCAATLICPSEGISKANAVAILAKAKAVAKAEKAKAARKARAEAARKAEAKAAQLALRAERAKAKAERRAVARAQAQAKELANTAKAQFRGNRIGRPIGEIIPATSAGRWAPHQFLSDEGLTRAAQARVNRVRAAQAAEAKAEREKRKALRDAKSELQVERAEAYGRAVQIRQALEQLRSAVVLAEKANTWIGRRAADNKTLAALRALASLGAQPRGRMAERLSVLGFTAADMVA